MANVGSMAWKSLLQPCIPPGYMGVYEDLRLNGLRGTTSLSATATRRGATLELTPQLTRCRQVMPTAEEQFLETFRRFNNNWNLVLSLRQFRAATDGIAPLALQEYHAGLMEAAATEPDLS